MNTDSLIKDLEDIINSIDLSLLPYQKGNSVRIKNYIIRKNQKGFLIYDCKTNKQVTKTHFKNSAIAIVKNLVYGKDIINSVKILDNDLLKHYNDAVFYKHKIKNTDDLFVRETRKIRLSVSVEETDRIRQNLEEFIFD